MWQPKAGLRGSHKVISGWCILEHASLSGTSVSRSFWKVWEKEVILDMYCMAIMRFKSVFIVVEVVLLQSPRSESGKAPQSVPPDHKQNPVLIKQLKDPGKHFHSMNVCTCKITNRTRCWQHKSKIQERSHTKLSTTILGLKHCNILVEKHVHTLVKCFSHSVEG